MVDMDHEGLLLARDLNVRSEDRLAQDCRELSQIDLDNEIVADHTGRIHSADDTFQIESRFGAFRGQGAVSEHRPDILRISLERQAVIARAVHPTGVHGEREIDAAWLCDRLASCPGYLKGRRGRRSQKRQADLDPITGGVFHGRCPDLHFRRRRRVRRERIRIRVRPHAAFGGEGGWERVPVQGPGVAASRAAARDECD